MLRGFLFGYKQSGDGFLIFLGGLVAEKLDGLKVFSATKAKEREVLGERITEWISKNPSVDIIDKVITQSSDSEFHCLTITLFFSGKVVWNPVQEYPPSNGGGGYRDRPQRG